MPNEPPHSLFQSQPSQSQSAVLVTGNRHETGRFGQFLTEFHGARSDTSGHQIGLVRIGVLSRDVEIFRRSVIASGNHALPACVAARGNCSNEALCPNLILLLSRARRNSRISIRITNSAATVPGLIYLSPPSGLQAAPPIVVTIHPPTLWVATVTIGHRFGWYRSQKNRATSLLPSRPISAPETAGDRRKQL
ncbi:unnamed protein product [Prunus armeniaca]